MEYLGLELHLWWHHRIVAWERQPSREKAPTIVFAFVAHHQYYFPLEDVVID